jgi:flagellar motor switch protein FliM
MDTEGNTGMDAPGDDALEASPATEADTDRVFDHEGSLIPDIDAGSIQNFDFRNPVFLPEAELRQIRKLHDDLARCLSARLSIFLRKDFSVSMGGLESDTYSSFIETVPDPSHLILFKAEPLFGVGVLEIDPKLALHIADRMLGGRCEELKSTGYLTEIETNLVDDFVHILLEEWSRRWKSSQDLEHSLIGRETNGRFLQTSPANAVVLVAALDTKMGECEGKIRISVPYYTLEPLIKEMRAEHRHESSGLALAQKTEWRSSYNHIPVDLVAEWNAVEMTVGELMQLRPGDLIELPRGIINQTRLRVENQVKFTGEIGLENGTVAVRIREKTEGETP